MKKKKPFATNALILVALQLTFLAVSALAQVAKESADPLQSFA